eukprot:1370685-Amorphochlora_amoeboformis.AAC.1
MPASAFRAVGRAIPRGIRSVRRMTSGRREERYLSKSCMFVNILTHPRYSFGCYSGSSSSPRATTNLRFGNDVRKLHVYDLDFEPKCSF